LLVIATILPVVCWLPPSKVAAATIWRYHFKTGQVLTYSVVFSQESRYLQGAKKAATTAVIRTYLARYEVEAVDSSGTASIALSSENGVTRTTRNGKVTQQLDGSPVVSHLLQYADGTQRSVNRRDVGSFAGSGFGVLPNRPVRIGDHWQTVSEVIIGVAAIASLRCTNTLRDVQTLQASVRTTCTLQGRQGMGNSVAQQLTGATESVEGVWTFDVAKDIFLGMQLRQLRTLQIQGMIGKRGTAAGAIGTSDFSLQENDAISMKLKE
jgi:hypothetical protein